MISLTEDQEFFNPCNFLVKYSGDYDENALVVVYDRNDVSKNGVCSFQANFIKYGISNNPDLPTINPRDLIVNNYVELSDTTETVLLTAGETGVFHDISSITYRITSGTTTIVIRDTPGGAAKLTLTGAADTTNQFKFDPPLKQTTSNSNWTAQLNEANTANITVVGVKKS
jgi:hypothetical protein